MACDKCSLSVALNSSNFVEKLCDEWVLSTSVCGTGSFSAHTATQLNEREHPRDAKLFYEITESKKRANEHLPQTTTYLLYQVKKDAIIV